MNLQEQERERAAEQWLDEAIGHLRDTGPRVGLEMRVLAGLHAHVVQRRRRWTFLVAVSAAAILVAALVVSWPRSKANVTPNTAHEASPPPSNITSAPQVAHGNQPPQTSGPRVNRPREVAAAAVSDRVVTRSRGDARQATFPAPAPLTDQGKLLQAYLRQTPQHELVLIAARQSSAAQVDDLSIAPIEIQDLSPKTEKDQN